MLPNTTIHINPKFRKIHINPSFLGKSVAENPVVAPPPPLPTQIYINPRFLQQFAQRDIVAPAATHDLATNDDATYEQPLADTSVPMRKKIMVKSNGHISPSTGATKSTAYAKPLIKIGMRKLIRIGSEATKPSKTPPKIRIPILTKYKIVKEQTAYKIDRRSVKCKRSIDHNRVRNVAAVKKVSLSMRRTWISESLTATKVNRSQHIPFDTSTRPPLGWLNINGIIYKRSKLKLRKTDIPSTTSSTKFMPTYRRLSVRGENFLLDANGKNLIRVAGIQKHTSPSSSSETAIKRIDIGHITFVQKSDNTFERTDYHKNRFHLNVAKQRSISFLTSKLVKSNVPCPIYRKLGKCAAFDRSKCAKVHDPKQVDICQKYLKGACMDLDNCLLSHNVTLSKMPTCRFYLLGMCAKDNCPYLHKKVTEKTSICIDFLKGYCEQAAKCPRRHEFACPEFESRGECKVTRCPYPHRTQHQPNSKLKTRRRKTGFVVRNGERAVAETDKEANVKRYFIEKETKTAEPNRSSSNQDEDDTIIVVRKPKLGALPSYIPLG